MHNFRRNTCWTWSNSIQEKIQKSKSPSAPSHCLFLTNTNNHPACFLLCQWNILFALIALFKWLARQLCRDRSRDEECESSIPCWVHCVRLNGDELAPVTSRTCRRTPVHAHGHKQSVLPQQESKEANHCFFESGFVSVMTRPLLISSYELKDSHVSMVTEVCLVLWRCLVCEEMRWSTDEIINYIP